MNAKLKRFFTFSLGILVVDFIYTFMIKERSIWEPGAYVYIEFVLFYFGGMVLAYALYYMREIIVSKG